MRNRPDALDRRRPRLRGGLAVGDVGEQLDGDAVGGRGRGRSTVASAARVLAVARRPGRRPRRRRGRSRSVPVVPSTSSRRAGGDLHGAGRADHAGDAELAGDDRGVAGRATALGHQGEHDLGVQAGGVGGSQVLGDQHRRRSGAAARRARARPTSVRDHAALDVAQVGGPLGHQPAHAGEDVDELLDAPRARRRAGRSPPSSALRTAAAQPLVAGQPGARGQHLGRRAGGPRGLGGEPVGDRLRGDVVRRQRGVGVGEAAVAERARSPPGSTSPRTTEGGTVGDARDDRGAAEAWAAGESVTMTSIQDSCASLTVNTFGRKTT